MKRISTLNRSQNLFGAGKDGFRDGNLMTATEATEFDAVWCNNIQEELASIVESVGLALNPASYTQVLDAIKRMIDAQAGNYALDTGGANAYVVALDPVITAYSDGMTVRVKAVNGNTGASTLNAGAGAVPLVNDIGGALVTGDVPGGGIFTATFVPSANKFYITGLVPSQAMSQAAADARYAPLNNGKTVGEPFMHLGDTAPTGALVIPIAPTNISRTAYAAFHAWCAARSYPWGVGDGSTTFGMPYLAADYALVQSNGNVRTTTVGALLAHTHTIPVDTGSTAVLSPYTPRSAGSASIFNQTTGSTGGSANLAAAMRVLLCVQYQ